MTPGETLMKEIDKYCPSFMEIWGENRGPTINRWSARWGWPNGGQFWCGIGLSGAAFDAGVWTEYGGSGMLSPSVSAMVDAARRLGWMWDGREEIPPGAIWADYGVHTEGVRVDHGPLGGLVTTRGFNSGPGGCYEHVKSVWGNDIIIPPSIKIHRPEYKTEYLLEDPRAKQIVMGTWNDKSDRDRVLEVWAKDPLRRKYHPRPHRTGTGKATRYLIIGGPVRYFGPYATAEMREDAWRVLVPRLRALHHVPKGQKVMRKFSRKREVA